MNSTAIRTEQSNAAVTCLAGTYLEFKLGTSDLVGI
jgi:hypothetical protein